MSRANASANPHPIQPAKEPILLESLEAIRSWQKRGSAQPIRFDVRASITFVSQYRGRIICQDGEHAQFFQTPESLRLLIAGEPNGTCIRLIGSSDSTMRLNVDKLELLEQIKPITPLPMEMDQATGSLVSRFILTEGVVVEALHFGQRARLLCEDNGSRFEVWVYGARTKSEFVGHRIRSSGALTWVAPSSANTSRFRLLLRDANQLEIVEESSENSKSVPVRWLGSFGKNGKPEAHSTGRLRAKGVVVHSNHVDRFGLISNGRRLIIQSKLADQVEYGKEVLVTGIVTSEPNVDAISLKAQETRSLQSLEIPDISSPPIENFAAHDHGSSRIRIRGTILSSEVQKSECRLRLHGTGGNFDACIGIRDGPNRPGIWSLSKGTEVILTGMPVYHPTNQAPGRSDIGMTLLVGTDADCEILSRPSQFSGQTILIICLSAFGMVGGVLLWNHALRREVAKRNTRLSDMQAHMHTAMEAMPEAILILDRDDRVVWANDQFAKLFGVQLRLGARIDKSNRWRLCQCFESPTSAERLWLASSADRQFQHSQEMRMASGAETVQMDTHPIVSDDGDWAGRLWVFEDITVRRRMHAELLQAQRAEAIGHLSGGLAHEFNNFLTVIRSSLELLSDRPCQSTPRLEQKPNATVSAASAFDRDECLSTARMAVDRATELIRKLLGFARGVTLNRRPTDILEVVNDACDLVESSLSHIAQFKITRPTDSLWANVDRQLLEQAIINLCLNARDSIEGDRGVIQVSTSLEQHRDEGEMIRISVSDNGCGMRPEIIRQATEPFFTTKDVGDGTGLGLSVVEGVIQQHGGHVECESDDGAGTTFHLLLPRIASGIDRVDQPSEADAITTTLRILLVDDDSLVRRSATQLLRQIGHDVAVAKNGMNAISMVANEGPFDVVLMDLTMPEMSGVEAYYEILSAWPNQRVVFCTGYYKNLSEVMANPSENSPPLLRKPFSIAQLKDVLTDVMSRPPAASQPDVTATDASMA